MTRGVAAPSDEARREALTEAQRRYQRSEKAKAARAARREQKAAYDKARYLANPHLKQQTNERVKAWKKANPSRARRVHRRYHLAKHYGVSLDDFRNMLVGQAGRCLICLLVPQKELHVDHDHATGKVRGLLCGDCNKLLGYAKDDPRRLTSAIRYLEASR